MQVCARSPSLPQLAIRWQRWRGRCARAVAVQLQCEWLCDGEWFCLSVPQLQRVLTQNGAEPGPEQPERTQCALPQLRVRRIVPAVAVDGVAHLEARDAQRHVFNAE